MHRNLLCSDSCIPGLIPHLSCGHLESMVEGIDGAGRFTVVMYTTVWLSIRPFAVSLSIEMSRLS